MPNLECRCAAVWLRRRKAGNEGRKAGGSQSLDPRSRLMILVIEHVMLIDGTGAPPQADTTVLVEGDRIIRVARSAELTAPQAADTIDGRGKFLLPGLIDMHVHVALVGEEALPLWLGTGITTVRDVGGDIEQLLP